MAPNGGSGQERTRSRKRNRKQIPTCMDFERLEPRKQSSRVGAVRILPKRPVREKASENDLNASRKCLPNGATGPPWALLGPTCEILKDFGGGCFLLIFGAAENYKEIESITDLLTPRDPKHSQLHQPGRPPNSLRSQHSRQRKPSAFGRLP